MMALVSEVLTTDKLEAIAVQECEALPSAKLFLQSRPAGVYTCARTRAKASEKVYTNGALVEWSFHLQRLAAGLANAIRRQVEVGQVEVGYGGRCDHCVDALDVFGDEVHICPMPQPKCLTSTVLVYGEGRENAKCKHTQWIEDRVPIEHVTQLVETRGEPIHEVLLSKSGNEGDRLLLEGLITNFFVVKDGTLFTADEGVLEGSTRELVLKACRDLAIPVVLEAPKLSERGLWQAAFVTSAVRVVIDVTRLLCEEGEGERKVLRETLIPSDSSGFTQIIRDQIFAKRMYLD